MALDDITRNSVHIEKKNLRFGGTPWFRGKPKKKLVKKMDKLLAIEDKNQESAVLQDPKKYFSGRIGWLVV